LPLSRKNQYSSEFNWLRKKAKIPFSPSVHDIYTYFLSLKEKVIILMAQFVVSVTNSCASDNKSTICKIETRECRALAMTVTASCRKVFAYKKKRKRQGKSPKKGG
jgi:hypothetical protein